MFACGYVYRMNTPFAPVTPRPRARKYRIMYMFLRVSKISAVHYIQILLQAWEGVSFLLQWIVTCVPFSTRVPTAVNEISMKIVKNARTSRPGVSGSWSRRSQARFENYRLCTEYEATERRTGVPREEGNIVSHALALQIENSVNRIVSASWSGTVHGGNPSAIRNSHHNFILPNTTRLLTLGLLALCK